MGRGFLRLGFALEVEGVCTLFAEAACDGFAGKSSGLFNTADIEEFAKAISEYPLPPRDRCSVATGFGTSSKALEQEHLGIEVYPIDSRGHIGVQVRMATPVWDDERSESQKVARVELRTTYQPLGNFSRDLLALIKGSAEQALLEEEAVP